MLALRGAGAGFEIIAANSPGEPVARGARLTGAQIREIIEKVATEMDKDPEVKAHIELQSRPNLGTQGNPVPIGAGAGSFAQGAGVRARKLPAQGERTTTSATEGVIVNEKAQLSKIRPGVTTNNPAVLRNNVYPEKYGRMIEQLKSEGMSDAQIGYSLTELIQTGSVPGQFLHVETQLHELHRTMFGAEGTRARSAPLYAAMSLQFLETGRDPFTAENIFGARIGITKAGKPKFGEGYFPATGAGTQKAMRLIEEGVDPYAQNRHLSARERRSLRSVAHRQENLASLWLRENDLYDICVQDLEEGVRQVTNQLKAWFKGQLMKEDIGAGE